MKLPFGGRLREAGLPGAAEATALIQRTLREAGLAARLPQVLPNVLPAGLRGAVRGWNTGKAAPTDAAPGRFVACHLGGASTGRSYKLYVPSGYRGEAAPLIVMLHGCTQSPDDFAAGTRMNVAAEAAGCLVAYPEQTASANSSRCWNWFSRADQLRDQGEPALIAAMTREVMATYAVDTGRVFVAGLSAGGAAAAIMAATYPDLYAAIGVHSGLACGAAHDVGSAFSAMRDGHAGGAGGRRRFVPAIVFHGDRDTTVNPRNADAVIAQAAADATLAERVTQGQVPGGRAWRRTEFVEPEGQVRLEQWAVQGQGHAWSGGSQAGSYTDPTGPDATAEMLRFFLAQKAPAT